MARVGLLSATFRSAFLYGIWAVEALNYAVHELMRPVPWNHRSRLLGYSLWAVQLWCFFKVQLAVPPVVTDEWRRRAEAGLEPSVLCRKTGELLPPRSRYVRSSGGVVLGFDHFCYWLGTPIGLHNRKAFVLFVGYSALFCGVGALHSFYELGYCIPLRQGQRPLPELHPFQWWGHGASWGDVLYTVVFVNFFGGGHQIVQWFLALFEGSLKYHGRTGAAYIVAVLVSTVINPLGCTTLGLFWIYHLWLVVRNRSSLDEEDRRYDIGAAANFRQVFGERTLLWLLPVVGDDRGVDGYHWPRNEQAGAARRRARDRERDALLAEERAPRTAGKASGAVSTALERMRSKRPAPPRLPDPDPDRSA